MFHRETISFSVAFSSRRFAGHDELVLLIGFFNFIPWSIPTVHLSENRRNAENQRTDGWVPGGTGTGALVPGGGPAALVADGSAARAAFSRARAMMRGELLLL